MVTYCEYSDFGTKCIGPKSYKSQGAFELAKGCLLVGENKCEISPSRMYTLTEDSEKEAKMKHKDMAARV